MYDAVDFRALTGEEKKSQLAVFNHDGASFPTQISMQVRLERLRTLFFSTHRR